MLRSQKREQQQEHFPKSPEDSSGDPNPDGMWIVNVSTRSADCNGCSFCPKVVFASETVTTEAHAPDAETETVLKDSVEKMASCEILPLK